jgi:hypothetical protein
MKICCVSTLGGGQIHSSVQRVPERPSIESYQLQELVGQKTWLVGRKNSSPKHQVWPVSHSLLISKKYRVLSHINKAHYEWSLFTIKKGKIDNKSLLDKTNMPDGEEV